MSQTTPTDLLLQLIAKVDALGSELRQGFEQVNRRLDSVEVNQSRWFPPTQDSVGVDVGLTAFATLSTGEEIDNPRYLRKAERKLKTAQRSVSRKKKGSNRRRKHVRLLAKQHEKIKRQRQDFHHKTALQLIREFDELYFESLNIKGLVKNEHLAKSISDAAWGTFLLITKGKAAEAGRTVQEVPAALTSQLCSSCGARMKLTLAMRIFRCSACGLELGRDHNAALNIKQKAGAPPAGMEGVGPPREPRTTISSQQPVIATISGSATGC